MTWIASHQIHMFMAKDSMMSRQKLHIYMSSLQCRNDINSVMTCGTGYTMRWKGRDSSNAMKARQKDNLAKGIWSHLSTEFSVFSLAS